MVKSQQQSSSVRKSCSGKVHKAEYNEMRQYLSKLKDLVPNMPKNRKVSKVEVIEHVIDYICQLQLTLENDPAAVLVSAMLENNNQIPANANRQPLGAIAANPNGLPTICSLEVSPCENSDCANRTVPC